jgi:excisionase family DNA binding protein
VTDRILTFDEALEKLKVSRPTLYHALQNGQVPAMKVGRSWRISEFALNERLRGGVDGGKGEGQAAQ